MTATLRSLSGGWILTARSTSAPRDGERAVGQVPDVPPEEALAFFTRRYDALVLEVSLLERRIASKALSPDDAAGSIKTVRTAVTGANAVGDLDGLLTRLQALSPVVDEARAAQRAEKARQLDEVRVKKEHAVTEAEALATGNDWRGGVNRFRVAARGLEGAPPARPGHRRRPVAPLLDRPDDLHPAAEGPVRPAERRARERARGQGAAGRRGRGARDLDRLGTHDGRVPRPHDPLEGRRRRPARRRRAAVAPVPDGAGHVLRGEADDQRRAGRRVPRERRGQGRPARRGRGPDAARHRPRRGPRRLPRAARALVGHRQGPARLDASRSTRGCTRSRPRSPRPRTAAGTGPTPRPAPGPRTRPPSSRPRSRRSRSRRPRRPRAATTRRRSRPATRRRRIASGSRRRSRR